MKAKTLMNKIIIVGGLSACLLLGGCGAGQAADATSAESTFAAQESTVTPTESTETAETLPNVANLQLSANMQEQNLLSKMVLTL